MGALTIDFEGQPECELALRTIGLHLARQSEFRSIRLDNEKGDQLGFTPEYYVSHRVSDVDEWHPTWVLPADVH
ncbi:MAG: hypothetical protein WCE83_03850 [Candidatus Baltobacteraceae bacterium]